MSLSREQRLEGNDSNSSKNSVDLESPEVVNDLQPLVGLLLELNLMASPKQQEPLGEKLGEKGGKEKEEVSPSGSQLNGKLGGEIADEIAQSIPDNDLGNGEEKPEVFGENSEDLVEESWSEIPQESPSEVDDPLALLFNLLLENSPSTNFSEKPNLSPQDDRISPQVSESVIENHSGLFNGKVFEEKLLNLAEDSGGFPSETSGIEEEIPILTQARSESQSESQLQTSIRGELEPDHGENLTLEREVKEDVDPFAQLQDILMGSQMSQVKQVNQMIDQKVKSLEQQLYDPNKLVRLLLPHITNLLSLKIAEEREEMAAAIAPIIDEALQKRSEDDKSSVISALAPLIPDAISTQIRNNPQEVARAIGPEVAAAIQEQINLDREAIAEALGPEMGRAIKAQIEVERDAMVDALYPVIGNTISKYMAEAIRSINERVERAFSLEGVSRKIRSKVQGVSEAELILKESIPCVVQAAFLIQKSSGLIIAEVQKDGEVLEAEMIAGMLTAMRSFVQDCIVPAGELSELNQIEYGDSQIMLEVAGYCYLAVIIKGQPSKVIINELRETLAKIIIKYGRKIENFEGDSATIPSQVFDLLARLMDLPLEEVEKREKFPLALLGIILGGLGFLLIPWLFYLHRQGVEREMLTMISQAFYRTPDLSIYQLQSEMAGKEIILRGRLPNQRLREKAETLVKTILPNQPFNNQIIVVDVPPDPLIVESEVKRITKVFNQTEGISIQSQYRWRQVNVTGTVMQMSEGTKITKAFQQIPGVQSVVSTIKLNPLKIATRIYFEQNSVELNDEYKDIISNIKLFLKQYPQKHLRVIGYSDRLGKPAKNKTLALQRAQAVQQALISQGVDPKRLQVIGSPLPPADVDFAQPLLLSRCVVFEPFTP